MTEQNSIKLNGYPDIKYYKKNEYELEIFCRNEKGFNILLQTNQRESTLHFGAFHWHYDFTEYQTNEMLNQLLFGLTGITRLKVFSKKNKAYKWILQIQDRDGNWFDNGSMGLINFNFWTTPDIKYFQNDLLPKSLLYSEAEKTEAN